MDLALLRYQKNLSVLSRIDQRIKFIPMHFIFCSPFDFISPPSDFIGFLHLQAVDDIIIETLLKNLTLIT